MRPPLVERALELAFRLDFERSCREADGRLLHVLAGRRGVVRAGEIGTGAGVAAAWIVSALEPGVPFVTVELDPMLAASAGELFTHDGDVKVVAGDWREALPREAPFDFLFVHAGDAKADPDAVLGLLAPRATVVLDDFRFDPASLDRRRDGWLQHPALNAISLRVTPERCAIVASRWG